MNHDREHKTHRLCGVAGLLEHDAEVRALFTELGMPDEWMAQQAVNIRRIAEMLRGKCPANTQWDT